MSRQVFLVFFGEARWDEAAEPSADAPSEPPRRRGRRRADAAADDARPRRRTIHPHESPLDR